MNRGQMRKPPTTSILDTPPEITAARDKAVKHVEELLGLIHERANEVDYSWQGVAEAKIFATLLQQIVQATE